MTAQSVGLSGVVISPPLMDQAFEMEKSILSSNEIFFTPGANPHILVSAVHGVEHIRDGVVKKPDRGTIAVACLLHLVCGCGLLVQGRARTTDANFHTECEIKDFLASVDAKRDVHLAIDIHSSHPARPYDIEIGTMDSTSIQFHDIEMLYGSLSDHGFVASHDKVFKGIGKGETMTAFWRKQGVDSVQLEISSWMINGEGGSYAMNTMAKMCNALALFIRKQTDHKRTVS